MTLRWVFDSDKYNEWMNPVDFETEEAVAEQERLGLVINPGALLFCSGSPFLLKDLLC